VKATFRQQALQPSFFMSLLSENVRRVYGFFDEVFDNHEHH
jgi:hypothetical protein